MFTLITALGGNRACADNVNIDKARLFENAKGEYVLEVDTSPVWAAAYRKPILPERFEITTVERDRQTELLVVRFRFQSQGALLSADDELLLPWGRAGTYITAQWSDGSAHQSLFLTEVDGIHVPIGSLKAPQTPVREEALRHLRLGLSHAVLDWNHWLLAFAIGILGVGWWRIGLAACFAAGQAVSLVMSDLRLLWFPFQPVEICVVLAALLIARAAARRTEVGKQFALLMIVLGAFHGAASAGVIQAAELGGRERSVTLFMFNLGVDLVQFATVACLSLVIGALSLVFSKEKLSWIGARLVGGGAVAGLVVAFMGGSHLSHKALDNEGQQRFATDLSVAQMTTPGGGTRSKPAREFTDPLASFLTVEPYAIRLEVLIRLKDAVPWLERRPTTDKPEHNTSTSDEDVGVIEQELLKQQLVKLVAEQTQLRIDGILTAADNAQANFVTVEPGGIFSRPSPVVESMETAVVGVVFVFDTRAMADEVQLDWTLFPDGLDSVPATLTDPFGGNRQELSRNFPQLTWKNRWPGYRPATVMPVEAHEPRFPIPSILLIVALVCYCYKRKERFETRRARAVLISVLTVAVVLYPFARVSIGMPIAGVWKLSAAQASDVMDQLLTNVYRAYDLRDEDSIYDRLSQTVAGDELTEIYLDTRRSLELENRGGARAKVDEVDILNVQSIGAADDGGFEVDVEWLVSGSVTHFGHTHYRRNRYRAVVVIAPDDGIWKIRSISVGEQQRIL